MKAITKLAIGAAVLTLVAAGVPSAQAACAPPGFTINFNGAYLISNPDWCGSFGCYDSASGPSVSSNLSGFFWGYGASNGARLAGVDNGAWTVDRWTKQVSLPFSAGLYHYPAFMSVDDYPTNPPNVSGPPLNWASTNTIDGCITDITPTVPFDECTCVLLTDQWNGQGYYAILSRNADALGNFEFFPTAGETINFGMIPRAEITGSSRNGAEVTFNINVPTPTGGDYRAPGCDCNFGFRVYAQVVGEGGMVSPDRRACTQDSLFQATGQDIAPTSPSFNAACTAAGFSWLPALAPGGTAPQGVTPFNGGRATSSVTVNCGDPGMGYDVHLATSLGVNEANGGVQLSNVGANSFQVKCGNYTLAEPNRPERIEAPGRSGEAPRGRDTNRGSRERGN